MLQSLTINFKGTRILLNIQKQSPRGVLQTCSEFTGEHPCICVVFINLNSGFGCSLNLLHICRIPYCHFVRKPLGDCFWIFFSLFSQLIFNFIRFVIQVKENLHGYILARLIDENKYICRFHASFSVLKAVSTTRLLMKNSCCESFKIIFQAQVIPFSPTFMQKKSSFWEIIQFLLYLLPKRFRNAFLRLLVKLKCRWLFNSYRHATSLKITDVLTVNYSWANLLKQCRMLICHGLD